MRCFQTQRCHFYFRHSKKRFGGKRHFLAARCNVVCNKTQLTFLSLHLFYCFFFSLYCSKYSMTDLWLKYPCAGRFWQCYNPRKTFFVTSASFRTRKKTALVDLVSVRQKNVTHIEGLLMSVLVLLHSLNGRLGRTQSRWMAAPGTAEATVKSSEHRLALVTSWL